MIHLGATSQHIVDTGLVLQLRDAPHGPARRPRRYRPRSCGPRRCTSGDNDGRPHTPSAGRPITFRLKAAGWLGALTGLLEELDHVTERTLVLQFSGTAGTLASLGEQGIAVTEALAVELDLAVPALPWHSERTRLGLLTGWLATTSGALSKIGNDVVLLQQHEAGEVRESTGEGKGRSSAMPHKRNPVETLAIRTSAHLLRGRTATLFGAMEQEHERAIGGWQAEWTALPDAVHLVGSMLERTRSTLTGLEVDGERMRTNLASTLGLPLAEALGPALGAPAAYKLVSGLTEEAAEDQRHLREVARQDATVLTALTAEQVEDLLQPEAWLGSTSAFIDRSRAAWQQANG